MHNPGQCGVGPDSSGAHGQQPVDVDGRPGHPVSHRFLYRDGFAGQHRLIDGGTSLDDLAVDGYLLPGPHQQQVADLHLLHGHQNLLTVDEQAGFLGAHLQQFADRLAGLAGRSGLEIAAQHHERDDQSRGVEEQRPPAKSW